MPFQPGDFVHVRSIGKGVVRETRNGGRLLVEVGGRSILTTEDQVTPFEKPREKKAPVRRSTVEFASPSDAVPEIDLHGLTVEEATARVESFINDALIRGAAGVRVIHGRSGGKLKAALHARLKKLPVIRRFALDPQNPGVTIVSF